MFGIKKKEKAQSETTKKTLTEEEVLQILEIPNFKKMKKEKIELFTSKLPEMDVELIKSAMQQFPHFAQMTAGIVTCYKDMMTQVLDASAQETKSFCDSCDKVIGALNLMLEKDKLRFRQKKFIIEQLMQVLKMKDLHIAEDKDWFGKLVRNIGIAAAAIVGIVGAVGFKFLKK